MAMKRLVMMVLVALAIGSCAYRAQPVYNVDNPLPPSAQSLSLAQIESRIIEGGAFYQWQMRRADDGHLVAVHTQPKFSATVDIYFDRQGYKIIKQSTVGFRDTGTTIHDHYNAWIRNLEKGIDARLAAPLAS
jgi:opacity protein-like surface antigen